MVATANTGTWHWQERFEPVDVEGAARRQILNVRRSIAYDHWLKKKSRSSREDTNVFESDRNEDGNEDKQAEIDAAFQDWLQRKRKTSRKKKIVANNNEQPKPSRKPPSLHVNPKTKSKTRKPEQNSNMHHSHSEAERQQAYNAWLARVLLEDRIRRAQRREELDRLEQQQREKHKFTWRKNLAVCAYSTLVDN